MPAPSSEPHITVIWTPLASLWDASFAGALWRSHSRGLRPLATGGDPFGIKTRFQQLYLEMSFGNRYNTTNY